MCKRVVCDNLRVKELCERLCVKELCVEVCVFKLVVCVCVYHLYRCKTSLCCRGVWHSCPTTRNEAVDMSGKGSVAGFLVPAALYIESRPWAHISRSWGDIYILLLLVYMVNFHCDYTSIYIYMYIHLVF